LAGLLGDGPAAPTASPTRCCRRTRGVPIHQNSGRDRAARDSAVPGAVSCQVTDGWLGAGRRILGGAGPPATRSLARSTAATALPAGVVGASHAGRIYTGSIHAGSIHAGGIYAGGIYAGSIGAGPDYAGTTVTSI
jgi:hypothetical protein